MEENKKLLVAIKRPYEPLEITTIDDKLENFQEIVDGYIEMISLPGCENVDIICNEEGKLNSLDGNFFVPENEDCIVGNAIFTAIDEEGGCIDLTQEQIENIRQYVEKYKLLENEDLYENGNKIRERIYGVYSKEKENENEIC